MGEEKERIDERSTVDGKIEERFLSSRADRFAGAKRGEKSRLATFEMTVFVFGGKG